jgi:hypothetical protein
MNSHKTKSMFARSPEERDHLFIVAHNSGYKRATAEKITLNGKELYQVTFWA